jgi:integrase/recombinase XerD
MPTNYKNEKFQCSLAPLMEQFIHEKRACGYKYRAEARLLASFDRFLSNEVMPPKELPRSITKKWLAKQRHEKVITQHRRISIVRQFAIFMRHQGYNADIPDGLLGAKKDNVFLPRILTHTEIAQLLQAA